MCRHRVSDGAKSAARLDSAEGGWVYRDPRRESGGKPDDRRDGTSVPRQESAVNAKGGFIPTESAMKCDRGPRDGGEVDGVGRERKERKTNGWN